MRPCTPGGGGACRRPMPRRPRLIVQLSVPRRSHARARIVSLGVGYIVGRGESGEGRGGEGGVVRGNGHWNIISNYHSSSSRGRSALMSADTHRRGLQTFSSIIRGHSGEGTEHAITEGRRGGFNTCIYPFFQGRAGYRCGPPQQTG